MDGDPYALLETQIGHRFKDRGVLESALTHKSWINENPTSGRGHNERLEFLGDAVLGLAVGHLLMEASPTESEGELSRMRAAIVSEPALAEVAAGLGLGEWLFLGKGEEQSGGRRKPSVLADATEALIAAVYLDGGFDAAFEMVRRLFGARIEEARRIGPRDYKTRLQEQSARRKVQVRYLLVDEHGPDHDKTFEMAAHIIGPDGDKEYARGIGKTKKEAEQRAAEAALRILEGE